MRWSRKHPRLYSIVGVFITIGSAMIFVGGLWSLFNTEPLFPFLAKYVSAYTVLTKLLVIGIGLVFVVIALVFLVLIFRQTKPTNERPKILNLIDFLSAMNATPPPHRINPKQETDTAEKRTTEKKL